MRRLAESGLHLCVEAAGVRRVLHESDGAAERSRAIQRALRAAKDLDVIEILQPQVDEQRRLVDIGCHRRNHRRGERKLARGGFAVQTADDQRAAVDAAERSLVGEVDACHGMREPRDVLNAGLIQRGARHRRDADRKILRGHGAPARGDHHLLQRALIGGRGRLHAECTGTVQGGHHGGGQRADRSDRAAQPPIHAVETSLCARNRWHRSSLLI